MVGLKNNCANDKSKTLVRKDSFLRRVPCKIRHEQDQLAEKFIMG